MTTPITQDDIVQGAVKMLQVHDDVLAVLGQDATTETPYLFQYKLWAEMEGSQTTAAVISNDGGWTGPNVHNTLRFPRLTVQVYADPLRDSQGNITDPGEVQRRAIYAYEAIDRRLHRPEGGQQMWGSLRTIACARIVEPVIYPVPDGDGLLRLVAGYAITQG